MMVPIILNTTDTTIVSRVELTTDELYELYVAIGKRLHEAVNPTPSEIAKAVDLLGEEDIDQYLDLNKGLAASFVMRNCR